MANSVSYSSYVFQVTSSGSFTFVLHDRLPGTPPHTHGVPRQNCEWLPKRTSDSNGSGETMLVSSNLKG